MWLSAMGTQVQTKTHFPGYHSKTDLNDNASGGGWPLHNASKTLKNGQYHNLFSTKPSSDASLEHDKETFRKTILKHESVFRHQLHELHRLYKKQIDLMNGIKTYELHSQSDPAVTSQSIFSSPSAQSATDRNTWHASDFPSVTYRGIPSKPDMKERIVQSSRDYSMDAEITDCELLESQCKKPKKLLIDLELPAEEYICSEEEELDISAASRVESHRRDENLSCGRSFTFDCHGESSKLKLNLSRTYDLTNLKKPAQFVKSSTSGFVCVPTQTNVCSKDDKQRWNLSTNSHSVIPGKELPNFLRRDDINSNLHLLNDSNKKEYFPHSAEHGRTSSYRNNVYGTLCPENRRTSFDSSLVQNSLTYDQQKVEHLNRRRSIFGVKISDSDQIASVVGSHSELISSEPFYDSTQSRRPSALSDFSAAEEHRCSNSKMLTRNRDFARSFPWDSKPMSSLECLKDTNSTKDVDADTNSRYRNEEPSQQSFAPKDLQRKNENPQGGFCWLRDIMLRKSEASKEKGDRTSLSQCSSQDFSSVTHDQARVFKDPPYAVGSCNSAKLGLFKIDAPQSREQWKAGHGVNKGSAAHNTDFRFQFDLNICVSEVEEAQLRPSSPKIDANISAEIDLEKAAVGAEIGATPDHIRDAAEALVDISSSRAHNLEDNVICNISEASSCASLIWFAEIVSLHKENIESELKAEPVVKMDYFESMTLALTETKEEERHFEPHARKECEYENVLTKPSRRGQARRGRQQRKDFQREILPALIALSRHEVTDDLQIIEAMVGEIGGTWRASLRRRKNGAKVGCEKGRRNSGSSVTSPATTSACSTIEQSKSLVSWGKTTRRLPRQRRLGNGKRELRKD